MLAVFRSWHERSQGYTEKWQKFNAKTKEPTANISKMEFVIFVFVFFGDYNNNFRAISQPPNRKSSQNEDQTLTANQTSRSIHILKNVIRFYQIHIAT